MKRRKFLLTSGATVLGGTTITSISQQPAIGLNFDLVGTESVQPSNVETILIDFQRFELVPQYVDEGVATVTIKLDIDGHSAVKNQTTVQFENGERVDNTDLGEATPIVLDGVDTEATALDGTVTITVDHSNISDSYTQSFTITDDPLQNGLIGWWPLHEWDGRANDLSGNSNHGTLNGGVTQGVWGRGGLTSYSFDGSDDDVNVAQPSLSDFTVCAWAKKVNGGKDRIIIGSGENSSYPKRWWFATYNFQVNDGRNAHNLDLGSAEDGVWNHYAVTRNGNTATSYKNGEIVTVDESFTTQNIDNYGWGTFIGRYTADIESYRRTRRFEGSISDVRLYNRVLSQEEIEKLYQLGSSDYTRSSLHDGSDTGAVSRWKLEGGLEDQWGKNDLTDNTSGTGTVRGISGKARNFDAFSNDELRVTDNSTLDITDEITLSAWFYAKTDQRDTGTGEKIIAGKSDNYQKQPYQLKYVVSNNTIAGTMYDGSTDYNVYTDGVAQRETWNHSALVFDGRYVGVYLNGVLVAREDTGGTTITTDSVDFVIGNNQNGYRRYFNGYVDDVRLYDRALRPAELYQIYQWGSRGKDLRERTTTLNKSDMLGWWKLNETSGSTAYDFSGNGNYGQVNGAGPDDTGTVQSPTGGSAYKFDGSDDSIEASYIPEVSKNGIYSISVWVKPDSSVSDRHVFQNSAGTGNDRNGIEWENPELSFGYYDGSSYTSIGGDANPDEWNHFVGVNNQGSLKAYINGTPVTKNPNLNIDVDNKVLIGEGGTADAGYWKDAMSDVRIYNRILTPQEISYLYEQKF